MNSSKKPERSLGVHLVTLYFVSSGFLEAIHKYRGWGSTLVWNPFVEHSIWHLATDLV